MFKLILISAIALAAPTLSSQLEFYVKQNAGIKEQCEQDLKAQPSAEKASLDEIIKALKDSPRFPKGTSDMFGVLNTTTLPTDAKDIHASAEILNAAPQCWTTNSLAIQFKGAQRVIESGTKEQKDDFTAAFVARLRTENKKQLVLMQAMIYLQTLDQLAAANLLNSSAREEIHRSYQSAKSLSEKLHQQFPNGASLKDEKSILGLRRADLISSREVQAQIDSILKKI